MCSRVFSTFFPISFSVSGFMWRSSIHLDFSFVQGDKNGLICFLLPETFVENAYFTSPLPHWMALAPLSNIKWPEFWGFISRSFILFHWSACLSLYLCHVFFIRIFIQCSFWSAMVLPLEVLILLIIAFAIQGFAYSRKKLKVDLSNSIKKWALYKGLGMDQFAFFNILTTSWTSNIFSKCCIFSTGWF